MRGVGAPTTLIPSSEAYFKIKLTVFLDTSILKVFLKIIKTIDFRGDLSDISAKKTSLILRPLFLF